MAACQASLSFDSPGAYSNSCSVTWWCHPTISSSVSPFSSCLQSFSASGSFPMSQLFASGGQSIGASASVSILPMNIQGWLRLGLTRLISLVCGKIVFHQSDPWCLKGWGPLPYRMAAKCEWNSTRGQGQSGGLLSDRSRASSLCTWLTGRGA